MQQYLEGDAVLSSPDWKGLVAGKEMNFAPALIVAPSFLPPCPPEGGLICCINIIYISIVLPFSLCLSVNSLCNSVYLIKFIRYINKLEVSKILIIIPLRA